MSDPENPLPPEARSIIRDALAQLDSAERGIAKARLAGLNMDVEEKKLEQQRAEFRAYQRAYFPED